MNSISIRSLNRHTSAQAILSTAPLLVTVGGKPILRISKCFTPQPTIAQVAWGKARHLSGVGWEKLLADGPVMVSVYGSPWFVAEAWPDAQ